MSRNRTHNIYVEGGVRVDHLARVILERYPDARLRGNLVELDLGVPEEVKVPEPVTEAESAVVRGVDSNFGKLLGADPALDELLTAVSFHPTVVALREGFRRKSAVNAAAADAAASREDDEHDELQRLLRGKPRVP